MSKLSRLIGMASKALNSDSGRAPQSGGADWKGMVRSAADALTGDGPAPPAAPPARPAAAPGLTPPAAGAGSAADRAAIARYDYLMQTADPHQIELIHREAFERLTPAQRAQVEQRMRTELPPHERPASSGAPDLARAAARSEAANPGRLRGLLSRVGRGGAVAGAGGAAALGVGGAALGVLGAVAGGAVLSSIAGPLLEQAMGFGVDFDAIAEGVDLEAIASGVDLEGLTAGADGLVGGVGEQVSGFGEQLSNFEIPGLGDIFGR